MLAASFVPAQTSSYAYLSPQGDWQLCQLGISMPDCFFVPVQYMVLTDSSAKWTLTVTMMDGSSKVIVGSGPAFNLNFGGVAAHWSIAFTAAVHGAR